MTAKKQISEILIKILFAIIGFVLSINIIKDIISLIPLFNTSLNENELYSLISNTNIGSIYLKIGAVEGINSTIMYTALVAFFDNIPLFYVLFFSIIVILSLIYFIFSKWNLLEIYIKMAYIVLSLYVFKYIFYGLAFVLFYTGSFNSLSSSLIIGNVIFMIFSLGELFIMFLWILKMFLNIVDDVKTLLNN
ncbi:MAG: hypothetical protein SOU19_02680 [Candidatus Caccosoma sp.]|nr:hypothetical protein [Candidatus Caccosoma sp.]